jgi:WD40 repeat protein
MRTCSRRTLISMTMLAGMFATIWIGVPDAAARDLASMSADEIRVLQQRLSDAACYKGPIDGRAGAQLDGAKKACPDQEPVLRIETGMHVGAISRIGVDAQCRIAATASDDKTVRLWSLPDGSLLRTLRWPIGPGYGGRVFATAVSPEGRFVAAGGWDAQFETTGTNSVMIFDAATGSVVARVGGFEYGIDYLVFSPDGRWLAATLIAGGVRVIDATTWRVIASDKSYGDHSNGATFGPDGRLYTVAFDGKIRRYGPGPGFAAESVISAHGGNKPYSIAVDLQGARLAVGFNDSTAVDFYDAATLQFRGQADTKGISKGNLSSVAWRGDGQVLIAGGSFIQQGYLPVILFDRDGQRLRRQPTPVAENAIHNIQTCGAGFAMATGDPGFGLLGGGGEKVLWRPSVTVDMRSKLGDNFLASWDARRLRFGLGLGGKQPVSFDLVAATLTESRDSPSGLSAPRYSGLQVTNWQDNTNPQLAGRPIKLDQYEISRSLAISTDPVSGIRTVTGFVLGTEWYLRSFDAGGTEAWHRPAPGIAWGVNLAKNGWIIIAAYGDGTIRWHRSGDGAELLALFVNAKTKAWIAWTPSGYYMASPGGEDLIGWHINRGWNQAADFFPASRFRARFNRPDIVQLVLDTHDEAAAIKQANEAANRREETKPLEAALPPVVKILSPASGATFSEQKTELTYSLRSPSGLPIDRVVTIIDGSPTGMQGYDPKGSTTEEKQSVTIDLPPHDVVVGLVARSGSLIGDVAQIKLIYRGTPPAKTADDDSTKPVLYALLVGVANYQDPKLHLDYSAKDATDLATALQTQTGGLYRDVKVRLLTDREATVSGLKDGLFWLQKETTSRDLAIVFLAGHGVTDTKNQFWFLTHEADMSRLYSTAVSRGEIMDVLHDLPGKKILFLDACHAGAVLGSGGKTRGASVDLNSTINDFATADSGLVVYGAAMGRELSVENDSWQHGAFTKALLEAIGEGKADVVHKGKVTTALLDVYLSERVKQLTNGEQHPVMSRPDAVPDFPIALVK